MSTGGQGHLRGPGRAAPRVRLTSISERPTGVDERLAVIFRDMRWALSLTKPELARKLGTKQGVIDAMELGRIRALPAWPETVRIVTELGKLNRVDARPILARIRDQIGPAGLDQVPSPDRVRTGRAGIVAAEARPAPSRGPSPQQAPSEDEARERRRLRVRRRADRAARAVSALSAPVVMVAGLLWIAQAQPTVLESSVLALPEPLARLVRPVVDYVVLQLAPRRDGMRWIEVDDPRLRKSDKLRQAAR